jgi:uncharacterized membrane protein YphA (DoxX/SURF4 family)
VVGAACGRRCRRSASRPSSSWLWTLQALLAALFLFAGGMKLVSPIAALTQQVALPGPFLRFIGLAEVLGALGLILPGSCGSAPPSRRLPPPDW